MGEGHVMTTTHTLSDQLDERIPVTAMLTPSQSARLEVLIADIRNADPSIADDTVADALFDTGLAAFESMLRITEPAHEH